jgi:hypothetical protein
MAESVDAAGQCVDVRLFTQKLTAALHDLHTAEQRYASVEFDTRPASLEQHTAAQHLNEAFVKTIVASQQVPVLGAGAGDHASPILDLAVLTPAPITQAPTLRVSVDCDGSFFCSRRSGISFDLLDLQPLDVVVVSRVES